MSDAEVSAPDPAAPPPSPPTPASLGPVEVTPPPPARAFAAILLGASAARARVVRRPTALAALLGLALLGVATVIERRAGSAGAVDRVLGGTFRVIIPLVTFGVAAAATGHDRLRDAVWPLARYGASRRDLALGTILFAIVASATLAALFAILSVVLAHGPGEPPLLRDALQSAWIGALTASAYAAWFSFGAVFWKRGRGRWIPLLLDLLVGASTGLLGAVFPRGNAQSLLGGAAPLHLSQASSSAVLALSALALTLVASLLCRQ
jgi:hypothetical protein